MALAGVSYTVGREANRVYGETWNGIQEGVFQHEHYFKTNIDPYKMPGNPSGGLLPGISSGQPGTNGEGDDKIQAYCYRTCFTDHPENRKPFPRPEGYDAAQYELLLRVFQSGWNEVFNKFDRIPNLKTDVNNHGPVSFDYIGMNYDYPEASYKRRKEIARQHENYQKGMLYFIANDPRVPKAIQEKMRKWGLAADEFQDNENWPRQLYVREARRMISDYVMTEHQVLGRHKVPEPVGMGSYALDSHHTQRYVTVEGYVQNEGDIGVKPPRPYSISYRSIVPKETECGNLIVPVCISSSHIAYGSVRMEPVFMILGQSAAVAAVLALDMNVSVQDVDYQRLAEALKSGKQILTNDAR
ncbi:FAD-dependent oxidoreductase [Arcticibacter sp.]|uniref:FAD-dependent oxidoreductase n=1 Tax=Arcticibacter sp. TaxID=1872630 RepID=UPI00388E4B1A